MDTAQIYSVFDSLLKQFGLSTSLPRGSEQAVVIIIGVFLITLVLGLARHHMLAWSIKGAGFGIVMGAVLMLVLEGILLVGGKTAVGEIVKNTSTPENVRVFLQKNMSELASQIGTEPGTLGAASEQTGPEVIISEFKNLESLEREKVQEAICKPPTSP